MKEQMIQKRQYHICLSLLLSFVLVVGLLYGTNYTKVDAANTGTVTATSLNVREGPGTNYKKVQVKGSDVFIKKGDKVTIISTKSGWHKISTTFNGTKVEGYIMDEFVTASKTAKPTPTPSKKPTPTPTPTPKLASATVVSSAFSFDGKVTATNVNVRKSASTTSTRLGSVIQNQGVKVLNETIVGTAKWYRISYTVNKKIETGYVLSDYIKLNLTSNILGKVNKVSGIKLYKSASSASGSVVNKSTKKAITLNNKRDVMLTGETTDSKGVKWFKAYVTISKVRYTGFVPANQVSLIKSATVTPTKAPTKVPTQAPTQAPSVTPTPTNTPTTTPTPALTVTPTPIGYLPDISTSTEGKIVYVSLINVFADVINSFDVLYDTNYTPVMLALNEKVIISNTVNINGSKWYFVTFSKGSNKGYGYVQADYITVGSGGFEDTNTMSFQNLKTPSNNPNPTGGGVISDGDFESYLTSQGFPESYKPYLRTLHTTYPNWVFEAYNTGLDWNTSVSRQSKLGLNLISNGKSVEWKSFDTGAYNWSTDRFIPFDGSTWVTPSNQGLMYYMDPRNFLTERAIFQFETLTYKSQYQNASGVENILFNTALYNKSFTYKNDVGKSITTTFGDTYLAAALYSGVSPYHLATRSKQEVVTGTTTLSSSVTGTVAGYEGYYNFYNIGAYHSTAPGGAVANALKYSKNGSTSASLNATYLIPWDNPYDAIVGGSYIIGSNYIKRGQDTIYLQKFNVTPTSTHSHQYMANIEAPNAESAKTYTAYSGMLSSAPIVFSIPVYQNMPNTAVAAPTKAYNPNNWLKTLSISGYSLTPTFDLTKDQAYSIIVPENVTSIVVAATTVSTTATVKGTGTIAVNTGNNVINIDVTAQNGNVRTYQISVFREG